MKITNEKNREGYISMILKNKDVIAGSFIFIFALIFYFYSFDIAKTTLDPVVGSRFSPQLITILLMLLSGWLVVENIIKIKKGTNVKKTNNQDDEKEKVSQKSYFKTILVFLSLAIYLFLLNKIGFVIATILYLFSQMYILESRKEKRIFQYIIISVVTSLAVYYMFTKGFNMMLPGGTFF